jgi:Rrf2 family protein
VKLSRAASYAVEALAYLAVLGEGRLGPSQEAARARGIPEEYLLALLGRLVRAGLICGVREPNGGYRLARPAHRISLLDVVEAVDGTVWSEAPEVGTDPALNLRLQAVFDRATAAERRLLVGVSVADLAGRKRNPLGRNRS